MLEPGKTKTKTKKEKRGTQEKGKRAGEGRVWKVLHLAAWNVEKCSATRVKAQPSVTVKVITKSATEFTLQYEYMTSHK